MFRKNQYLILIVILSCNVNVERRQMETPQDLDSLQEERKIDNDSLLKIENNKGSLDSSTLNCDKLVRLIIESSDIDKELKKFHAKIDEIKGDIFIIKIYNVNDRKTEVPIAWLELDFRKNELRDITVDPETPMLLTFDRSLTNHVKKKCIP